MMTASVLMIWQFAGCSRGESGTSTSVRSRNEGWTTVRLPNTSRAEAFQAGEYAMKQWFRLEEVSPTNGQIRSALIEYTQKGGTERLRDVIMFPNRMRHRATLVVMEQAPDTVVRCAVSVQRLDTADHRVFQSNERFTDYPNDTPIDRGAGLSASQDQVWTDMPRDRQLESDILSVVKNRVNKTPPSSAPVG
jgi:hypothetical protein